MQEVNNRREITDYIDNEKNKPGEQRHDKNERKALLELGGKQRVDGLIEIQKYPISGKHAGTSFVLPEGKKVYFASYKMGKGWGTAGAIVDSDGKIERVFSTHEWSNDNKFRDNVPLHEISLERDSGYLKGFEGKEMTPDLIGRFNLLEVMPSVEIFGESDKEEIILSDRTRGTGRSAVDLLTSLRRGDEDNLRPYELTQKNYYVVNDSLAIKGTHPLRIDYDAVQPYPVGKENELGVVEVEAKDLIIAEVNGKDEVVGEILRKGFGYRDSAQDVVSYRYDLNSQADEIKIFNEDYYFIYSGNMERERKWRLKNFDGKSMGGFLVEIEQEENKK